MKPLTAVFLLLFIAVCFTSIEGSKCKCSRKGPKIRFSDIQRLEEKPKYPYCKERMIIVTMKSRFRGGHQYCLHPKLPSTKRLLKWYTIWKEKERSYRVQEDLLPSKSDVPSFACITLTDLPDDLPVFLRQLFRSWRENEFMKNKKFKA